MNFTTPPSTPPSTSKKLKCPWAPQKKKCMEKDYLLQIMVKE